MTYKHQSKGLVSEVVAVHAQLFLILKTSVQPASAETTKFSVVSSYSGLILTPFGTGICLSDRHSLSPNYRLVVMTISKVSRQQLLSSWCPY